MFSRVFSLPVEAGTRGFMCPAPLRCRARAQATRKDDGPGSPDYKPIVLDDSFFSALNNRVAELKESESRRDARHSQWRAKAERFEDVNNPRPTLPQNVPTEMEAEDDMRLIHQWHEEQWKSFQTHMDDTSGARPDN